MKVTFYDNDGNVEEVNEMTFDHYTKEWDSIVLISDKTHEDFQYERIAGDSPGLWAAVRISEGESLWWEVNGEALIGLSRLDTALLKLTKAILD